MEDTQERVKLQPPLPNGDFTEALQQAYKAVTLAAQTYATESAFAHVNTPPENSVGGSESVHVDLLDDTLIGDHSHTTGNSFGCVDGLMSVDLSEQQPNDVHELQRLSFSAPSVAFSDHLSRSFGADRLDTIAMQSRSTSRHEDGSVCTSTECDTIQMMAKSEMVQDRVTKMEAYMSAIASEVIEERQARQALAADFDERFRNIEEVVDRITTDLDRLACGLDKLGPLFTDPATMNLEQKFDTQAFATLQEDVEEYKIRTQGLEERCSQFVRTEAVVECAARIQLLDNRCNESISAQEDAALQQQEALTSVSKEIASVYDTHKSQIIKVTENMTWLGQELKQRFEHVESIVADEMKARLEHLEIVVAAQKVGLEKLRCEQGSPVKQQFGHDEEWQIQKDTLVKQVKRLSQDVAGAVKRVNESESSILAAVVGHLTTLADSIPRIDRNDRKTNLGNRAGRNRSLRISSQSSGTDLSTSNSPSRKLESDASPSQSCPNRLSLSIAAAEALINLAPEVTSVGSSRPSKASSLSRSPSLNVRRSASSSPATMRRNLESSTASSRARERRTASPLSRRSQIEALPAKVQLPTFESLMDELVNQGTKTETLPKDRSSTFPCANTVDREPSPTVSDTAAQKGHDMARRAIGLLESKREDALLAERQLYPQARSSVAPVVQEFAPPLLSLQTPQLPPQLAVPQLPQLQQQPLTRAMASVRLPAGVSEVSLQPPSGPMMVRSVSALLPNRGSESSEQAVPQQQASSGQPEAWRRTRSPEKVGRYVPAMNAQILGSESLRSPTPTPTWGGSKEATPFMTPRNLASGCLVQAPLMMSAQASQAGLVRR